MADEAFISEALGGAMSSTSAFASSTIGQLVAVFGAQTAGDSLDIASPCLLAREGLDADRAHEKSCTQKQRAANFRIHTPFLSLFAETSGFGKSNVKELRIYNFLEHNPVGKSCQPHVTFIRTDGLTERRPAHEVASHLGMGRRYLRHPHPVHRLQAQVSDAMGGKGACPLPPTSVGRFVIRLERTRLNLPA